MISSYQALAMAYAAAGLPVPQPPDLVTAEPDDADLATIPSGEIRATVTQLLASGGVHTGTITGEPAFILTEIDLLLGNPYVTRIQLVRNAPPKVRFENESEDQGNLSSR